MKWVHISTKSTLHASHHTTIQHSTATRHITLEFFLEFCLQFATHKVSNLLWKKKERRREGKREIRIYRSTNTYTYAPLVEWLSELKPSSCTLFAYFSYALAHVRTITAIKAKNGWIKKNEQKKKLKHHKMNAKRNPSKKNWLEKSDKKKTISFYGEIYTIILVVFSLLALAFDIDHQSDAIQNASPSYSIYRLSCTAA